MSVLRMWQELEGYIKKYKDTNLVFDKSMQKNEIETFCQKSTTLIECLLPQLPRETQDDSRLQDDVLSEI